MLNLSRLFRGPLRGPCDLQVQGRDQQNKAAPTEQDALLAVDAANKQLQSLNQTKEHELGSLIAAHAAHVQALLDLLSLQLRQTEKAVVTAQPDLKSCGAVKYTRAKLEDALTAAWQLVDWHNTQTVAGTTAAANFMDLYEQPSILGAMQFCRYFTSNAGLALLHKAIGADKQQLQQQQQQRPSNGSSGTMPDSSVQQLLRPFTLVVDGKGTGHVATLQAALDMAAMAARQRAQQHYSSIRSDAQQAAQAAGILSTSSISQQPAAANKSSAADADVQAGDDITDSTSSSAAACDNMLIVLLPGTYTGTHTLPGSIRHITIAGIPGSKALLSEAASRQHCNSSTPTGASRGFMQAQQQQQQQQHPLQEIDARMLRLQLEQRQAAAGQLLRSISASAAQQLPCQTVPCLLSCVFGVETLKLQHLHMDLAGAAGKHGAAQFQRVLARQDSAPASIGAVKGAAANNGQLSSTATAGSSSKGGCVNAAGGATVSDDEPYCIRLCSGSELRMEWCEFSGGAGGVLSEAGAMVAAMQCSFHQ